MAVILVKNAGDGIIRGIFIQVIGKRSLCIRKVCIFWNDNQTVFV